MTNQPTFDLCTRCGCCDVDEATGVCAGRCNAEGTHIVDQPPVVAQVDARKVVLWMRQCSFRGRGVYPYSQVWWNRERADEQGLGSLIDAMEQIEHENGEL